MGIARRCKFPLVWEFDAVVSLELSCWPEGVMVSLVIFLCSVFFIFSHF